MAFAQKLSKDGRLKPARVGRDHATALVRGVRGDYTAWIRDWSESHALEFYYKKIEALRLAVRKELFLLCDEFEAHWAYYSPGTFYRRHVDQHEGVDARKLSCILYLSEWKSGDGGELVLFDSDGREHIIAPTPGKFVCFSSAEFPHEVREVRRHRFSISGWLRKN